MADAADTTSDAGLPSAYPPASAPVSPQAALRLRPHVSTSDAPIELARLTRQFGPTVAVDDVSFAVARGQVFGYIGPNGAGKTTSMRILATLDEPTRGDARVDGFSVVDDPERVRRRLGFMPDDFGAYSYVTVHEYLDFFARAYGLMGAERNRAVRHVMSFTRLDEIADKHTDQLSKGMRQRLCLGRALIHDPLVLVLDEPAAALDPGARIQLREMIGHLAADGKTILISSHILTELAEMCDTVGILERGRLLAIGTVDDIQRQASPERTVEIHVLQAADALAAWLAARGEWGNIRVDADRVRVSHRGDAAAEAALLREIVLADFQVAQFGSQGQTLEQVFLQVTRGQVQ